MTLRAIAQLGEHAQWRIKRKKVREMIANNEMPTPGAKVSMTMAVVPLIPRDDVALHDLAVGEKLEVETGHHLYLLENAGDGKVLIVGHPVYCARPVLVDLLGASGEGQRFRIRGICRGAHMEFVHPAFGVVRTSAITDIRQLATEIPVGGLVVSKAS